MAFHWEASSATGSKTPLEPACMASKKCPIDAMPRLETRLLCRRIPSENNAVLYFRSYRGRTSGRICKSDTVLPQETSSCSQFSMASACFSIPPIFASHRIPSRPARLASESLFTPLYLKPVQTTRAAYSHRSEPKRRWKCNLQ